MSSLRMMLFWMSFDVMLRALEAVAGTTIAKTTASAPSTTRAFCMKVVLLKGGASRRAWASDPREDARPLASGRPPPHIGTR